MLLRVCVCACLRVCVCLYYVIVVKPLKQMQIVGEEEGIKTTLRVLVPAALFRGFRGERRGDVMYDLCQGVVVLVLWVPGEMGRGGMFEYWDGDGVQ